MTQHFVKQKKINAKCRLRSGKYANFFEYYHTGHATEDYLYKYLTNLQKIKSTTNFKSNFDNEGFNFKIKTFVKCKMHNGRPCILEDLYDRDVVVKLQIGPYDFMTKEGTRLTGISIVLLEATGFIS